MRAPSPTPIYRLIHLDALPTLILRGCVHAPGMVPSDGLPYPPIHDVEVQVKRQRRVVPCGPRGTVDEYVSFYFCNRSPMLFRHAKATMPLAVSQDQLLYLVSSAQAVAQSGCRFVLTDGHSLARRTRWFERLADRANVDWDAVQSREWADSEQDTDRSRRKQAEFLVHREMPWALIQGIGVRSSEVATRVWGLFEGVPKERRIPLLVRPGWYY